MGNYELLKSAVEQVIKTNGNQEITGELLKQTLISIISAVGDNYQFAGIATPATVPGTPDANVFYLATKKGTYPNFNSAVLLEGETAVFKWKGTWIRQDLGLASQKGLIGLSVQRKNNFDDNVILGKFRSHPIPFDSWIWTSAASESGITPVIGNVPIWSTNTDGFIEIPITGLNANGALYLGIVFECIGLKNVSNFRTPNAYIRVNTNAPAVFSQLKAVAAGNRFLFTGYFNISSLTGSETLTLLLGIHANDKTNPAILPIVAEFSEVRLFYVNTLAETSAFTISDSLASLLSASNTNKLLINQLETKKLNAVYGANKLNPNTFRYGTFYYYNSNDIQTGNNTYGTTDYIPADPAGLVTTGAGTDIQGLTSYVVFDAQKNILRRGNNTNQYTYVAGDAFVCFVYAINGNLNFAKTKAVFSGTVYSSFEDYTDFKPIEDVKKRMTTLEQNQALGVSITAVRNGTPLIYGNVSNFTGGAITERNIQQDYLVYTKNGLGNSWLVSPLFIPNGSNMCHVRGTVEFNRTNTVKGFDVFVAQQPVVGGKYLRIGKITQNGYFDIEFDPAFYTVYEGYTNFYIWINNETMEESTSILSAKFTGLQVLEFTDSVNGSNISGQNAKELFDSTDAALTEIRSIAESEEVYISPLGNKFELSVQDNGTVVALPVIPSTAAFFGNSLLSGFGYGMAASETTKDYYYLVTEFIKTLRPSFTSTRNGASSFEGITNPANIAASIQNDFIAKLTGLENLVSVQLGDNVNTPDKVAVFPQSSLQLLKAIRAKCPNARVVWTAMWYGEQDKYDIVRSACEKTGCKFISLADLANVPANKSAIGLLTKRGTQTRTLAGVTNVVANTATNITVTFVVGSTTYNSTLNVTSYSLSSGTLTYTGEYEIISSAGVASHPGDEGFRRIANRFLYEMKLTEDQEVYKTI